LEKRKKREKEKPLRKGTGKSAGLGKGRITGPLKRKVLRRKGPGKRAVFRGGNTCPLSLGKGTPTSDDPAGSSATLGGVFEGEIKGHSKKGLSLGGGNRLKKAKTFLKKKKKRVSWALLGTRARGTSGGRIGEKWELEGERGAYTLPIGGKKKTTGGGPPARESLFKGRKYP